MIRDRIMARSAAARQSPERLDQRGAVDIQNVDQALVRPDLGFKLTNEGYKKYGEDEQRFNSEYDAVVGSNTEAINKNKALISQIDQASSGLAPKSVEPLWAEAQAKFKPVIVGTKKSIIGEYALPADLINNISGPLAQNNLTGYWIEAPLAQATRDQMYQNPKDLSSPVGITDPARQNYFVVSPVINGQHQDEAVNNMMAGIVNQTKTSFYEKMGPAIDTYNAGVSKQIGDYSTKRAEVQKYIDTSEGAIDTADLSRESRGAQKEAYKQQYQESVGKRQALFR